MSTAHVHAGDGTVEGCPGCFADEIRSYPAAFAVTAWPEGLELSIADAFTVTVELRGRSLWAVRNGGRCLSTQGDWDYEPLSSSRSGDWVARHRFRLEQALTLAREVVPELRLMGRTLAQVLAEIAEDHD